MSILLSVRQACQRVLRRSNQLSRPFSQRRSLLSTSSCDADLVAKQAVRLYLPGSRLRLLRPGIFNAGVTPVLSRLRDLFSCPNYIEVYGDDDFVTRNHRVITRQPRQPVLWLDFGAAARETECSDLESVCDVVLKTSVEGQQSTPENRERSAPFTMCDVALNSERERLVLHKLEDVIRAVSQPTFSQQIAVFVQNYDAPFMNAHATDGDWKVAQNCWDILSVLGHLQQQTSLVNYSLTTGTYRLQAESLDDIFSIRSDDGDHEIEAKVSDFFNAQRDLSLDLSHNDAFGRASAVAEIRSPDVCDLFWFGGTSLHDDETPFVQPTSNNSSPNAGDRFNATTCDLLHHAFGSLDPAAVVLQLVESCTTFRREQEYVDANFRLATSTPQSASLSAELDAPALLMQAGALTLGRRISRFDEFHAFSFAHLTFSSTCAQAALFEQYVAPLLKANDRSHCEPVLETCRSGLPQQADDLAHAVESMLSMVTASTPNSTLDPIRLATMVLLVCPKVVPLPVPTLASYSLQDSVNVDTFSPLADSDVEMPPTVPVLYHNVLAESGSSSTLSLSKEEVESIGNAARLAVEQSSGINDGDETLKDAGELLVFVHPVESTASEAAGHQFEVHVVHENKGTLAVDKVVVC